MYALSDQQVDYIAADIQRRGILLEDLQQNLLDHICCILEQELEQGADFETHYQQTIRRFFKKELKEIEHETIYLLTFKHYYAMKKTMITTGTISVALFLFGSFFKLMHWPGASVLLVTGIFFMSFVFLPLLVLLKIKDSSSTREKFILGIAVLIGMMLSLAVLFNVMHWPSGNGLFWFIGIGMSMFVLTPLYFFTGIRNPDTRVNTIVTTIVLVAASGLLFTMMNTRPSLKSTQLKMYTYLQNEELLKRMQQTKDTSLTAEDQLVQKINNKCEQVKSLVLQNAIGASTIPPDFETRNLWMDENNLGIEFSEGRTGYQLLKEIKAGLGEYNASATVSAERKIPVEHSIFYIELDKMERYSNYAVLNGITQLQLYLAENENQQMSLLETPYRTRVIGGAYATENFNLRF